MGGVKTEIMKAISRDLPRKLKTNLRWIAISALVLQLLFAPVAPSFAQNRSDAQRRVVKQVEPHYPEIAKNLKISGTVRIALKVAPNGSIVSAEVIGGHPLLAKAAIDAVQQWRYETSSRLTDEVIAVHFSP